MIKDPDIKTILDLNFVVDHRPSKSYQSKRDLYLKCAEYGVQRDNDAQSKMTLIYMYIDSSRYDKALELFNTFYKEEGKNSEHITRKILATIADIYYNIKKDKVSAINWMKLALEINRKGAVNEDLPLYDNGSVEQQLALLYYYNNQFDLAYYYGGLSLKQNPNEFQYTNNYKWYVMKMQEIHPEKRYYIDNLFNTFKNDIVVIIENIKDYTIKQTIDNLELYKNTVDYVLLYATFNDAQAVQNDLSQSVIRDRYPKLKPLYTDNYQGYYILDIKENKSEYYYRMLVAQKNNNMVSALSYAYIADIFDKTQYASQMKPQYLSNVHSHIYNTNKVAVYAITKNEIKFVDKWFDSMSEADYICVLDTGSTDGTYEALLSYAEKYPDKIFVGQEEFYPWRFDVPRNVALKLVPSDANILLSTDLDEVLEPGWYQDLRDNWIEGKYERASYQYAWSHNKSGAPGRIFWYNKVHTWNWLWYAPVHELLKNVINESETYSSNVSLHLNKMFLHHYPDKTKSRGNYLPLLLQRRKENPDDYYGLIYLCHEYFYRGYYQESIDALQEAIKNNTEQDTLIQASCYLFMGDDYRELQQVDNAINSYLKAISYEPTYREPYLRLAELYIDQKEYTKALKYCKLSLTNTYRHYSWLEKDTSWTYLPYDLMSLAYYYSGDKKNSLVCAYKAYTIEPAEQRLKDNVDIILQNIKNEDF